MKLPQIAVRRPVATCCLTSAAVLIGLIALTRLPVNLLPPLEIPSITVWTTWPDAPPEIVAREITEPLESTLRNLPGAVQVRSISREGESLVTVELDWGADLQSTMLTARERLDTQRFLLPPESERPVILDADPDRAPMMGLILRSANRNDPGATSSLQRLAEEVLRPRLEQLPEVARARVIGGAGAEVQITIDPSRLAAYGLSLDTVRDVLTASNRDLPAGLLRRGNYRYALRVDGAFQSLDDMRETVIATRPDGALIRVGDVATVRMGERDRRGAVLFDGTPAIGVLVQKTTDANLLDASETVNTLAQQFNVEFTEVSLSTAFDQADFVRGSIRNALTALAGGGVLALIVLLAWFRSFRYALPVALTMPVAVIAAFGVFDAMGIGLNIMSIGGLALGIGMLVDNAIISVENIVRHRETDPGIQAAAGRGAAEVALPMAASTLTTIAVFLPMALTPGVAGQLFRDQAFAVTATLVLSWTAALTLLPALVGRWAGRGSTRNASQPARLYGMYRRAVDAAIDHPFRGLAVLLAFVLIAVPIGRNLPRSFYPQVDQGAFWIELSLAAGTSLESTVERARDLSGLALAIPGMRHTLATAGATGSSFVPGTSPGAMKLETARVQVFLDEGLTDARSAMAALRAGIPSDLQHRVDLKPPVSALSTVLGGHQADLSIRLYMGEESTGFSASGQRRMAETAETVRSLLAASDLPLTDVTLRGVDLRPSYRIEIDARRAARLDMEPARVAEAVRTYTGGRAATSMNRTDERVPIVVQGTGRTGTTIGGIRELAVDTPKGRFPLRTMATIEPVEVAGEIFRLDQTPMAVIDAEITTDDLIGVADRFRGLLAAEGLADNRLNGHPVEITGRHQTLRNAYRALMISLLFSILVVVLILAAQFESLRLPWIIIAVIPLALAGSVFVLALLGESVNIITWIGAIILVGIVVNDAILKVDFIVRAERDGLSRREAIHEAGRRRIRPILMTTVTTICGVLPLALGFGTGGELGIPLARTLIGGLILGTGLTLFVVPIMYSLVAGSSESRAADPG